MVIARETVLSEKTMLNPSRIESYAVYYKLFDKKQLMKELVDPEKQIRLEVWEYDPRQFSNDSMADSLSVVLSFLENEGESIVLIVESITAEFGRAFWEYIKEAGYEHKNKSIGEAVDSKNIKKHKNDVFRLAQLITADIRQRLSVDIAEDMKVFLEKMKNEDIDLKSLVTFHTHANHLLIDVGRMYK